MARRAGVAASSIRVYESIGLLPEPDRLHGQRRYDEQVANSCDCESPADCALFAQPGETYDAAHALRIVHVDGHCRR